MQKFRCKQRTSLSPTGEAPNIVYQLLVSGESREGVPSLPEVSEPEGSECALCADKLVCLFLHRKLPREWGE